MVAVQSDLGPILDAAESGERRRAGIPRLYVEFDLGVHHHHHPRSGGGGTGSLRLLSFPVPRSPVAVLRGAAQEHVPRRGLPHAAIHPDALAASGEFGLVAGTDLPDLRAAALHLAAE